VIKFLVRSRSSSAPRHRHLGGINTHLTVRVRSNTAQNSREQSPLIQTSTQEQTLVVQSPSTLSSLLEISYSPVSDLSPDFFDDLFPSSSFPVSHPILPSPIAEFPVSRIPPLFFPFNLTPFNLFPR